MKIIGKREERRMKESEGMRFHDTVCFFRRMKSKQKSRVLPRFYDVPSTEYACLFFLISFRHPLYPSLIILRTPRAILSTNAISSTERRGEKSVGARGLERSEHLGRTLCSSGDAQLLLVHGPGQSQATLNYLLDAIFRREQKLRRDSPRGNFVRQIEN